MIEILYLEPRSGEFSVDAIRQFLMKVPFALEDPADPSVFIFCGDAETYGETKRRRQQAPESGYPFLGLIKVTPQQISVDHKAIEPIQVDLQRFVIWLLGQYQCQVEDDYGRDFTELANQNPDQLYR